MIIQRKKFNITLLGESGVGKTSLINSFKDNIFYEEVLITSGIDSFLDI